mgnify:CR=1 FL=1|jgi:hypothetical protein
MRNAFNALCELASNNNWCWNIYCTTCGHSLFKAAFNELIRGKHPDESTWIITDWESLKNLEVSYPNIQNWGVNQQESLANIITNSSVLDLPATTNSTDWLGYLGLGLKYTQNFEQKTKQITCSIVPHLIKMIKGGCEAIVMLNGLLEEDGRELRWTDLELIEKSLL